MREFDGRVFEAAEAVGLDDEFESPTVASRLAIDGKRFVRRVSEGIVLSIIAVDIWAFTTLFGAGVRSERKLPYEYPVLGIISHFILVLVVAASEALQLADYEVATLTASVVAMLGALAIGWWVRHGVWVSLERSTDSS